MSINLSGLSAARNTTTTTAAASDRPEAQIWLNFGYVKTYQEDGEEVQTFVSLQRGIPLDQIEPFDLAKVKNQNMATLRRDQNKFLAALMNRAESLKPGESAIVCFDNDANVGIEMKRVGAPAAPIAEEEGAELPFSLR